MRAVLQAEIQDLSEGGAQILLGEALCVTSLLKIEYADKLLLGEVVYCRQKHAGWLLGIRVGQLCYSRPEIAKRHLMRDCSPMT